MEEALLARLVAAPAVLAILAPGGDTDDATAAWGEIGQVQSAPALVLLRVTAGRDYSHDGAVPLGTPLVQIDCLGRSYGEARQLARAVIPAIEAAAEQGGVTFKQSFLEADRDMPPVDLPGGDKAFRVSLDFSIFVKE
jgi:hypothetical protein